MRLTITDRLVANSVPEASACSFLASFYDDTDPEAWVLAAPTTIRYRIDDVDTGCELLGWTTATPATTATIAVTGNQNAIANQCVTRQRRQLTVEANNSLATQCSATHEYYVRQGLRT